MGRELLIWQLADSAFPAGGFAHSGGLEAAQQLGEIVGEAALARAVRQGLEQVSHAFMPLATAAHAAPERLAELDRLCEASTTNHVANRASRAQGRAWVATAAAAFGSAELRELKERCRTEGLFCHFAPVFGVICGSLGVDVETTQRLLLYLHLRTLLSSAVRLNLVGPLAAQSLQYELLPVLESLRERCRALRSEDAVQTAPLLDLYQAHHDRLYSRLFSS